MSVGGVRLDYRVTPEIKELVDKAARLLGQTEASFARSALTEKAHQVITEHTITRLSARDWDELNALLAAEPQPTKKLKEAAARYRKRTV